jgi:RNA polymerase sigma-B factor
MACSPSTLQRRDAFITRFLPLADALAGRHCCRFGDLIERDDLIQVARLALVQAAARITEERTAPAYLKRCITGALAQHLRDRGRLVRVPARCQSVEPWRHLSLDAPCNPHSSGEEIHEASSCPLDLLAAPPSSQSPSADSALVQDLLALLEPRQAAAIRLTIFDGLSLRQAGQRLGVSAITVCRTRRKALQVLQLALGPVPARAD